MLKSVPTAEALNGTSSKKKKKKSCLCFAKNLLACKILCVLIEFYSFLNLTRLEELR